MKRGTPEKNVDIVISNASGKPIYEQIASQITQGIVQGTLHAGDQLPSIRALANDLGVSVITTKRAYSDLENLGYISMVQGKGCYVADGNAELLREERLMHIERHLADALDEARAAGIDLAELHEMLDTLADD